MKDAKHTTPLTRKDKTMGFWDTVFKVGKEVFSEAADTTKQVSSHAKELKNASDDKLLRIVNNSSWNADGKEKMAAKGILRKRGYSEREMSDKAKHT